MKERLAAAAVAAGAASGAGEGAVVGLASTFASAVADTGGTLIPMLGQPHPQTGYPFHTFGAVQLQLLG